MLRNDAVTFGVEVDRTDGRPVPRVACPACWMALFCLVVQGMTGRQNGMVVSDMALLRRPVADATVLVLQVVPMHECSAPFTRRLQRLETLGGKLRALLGGTKQRLRIGVVIAHPWARVHALIGQHGHDACRWYGTKTRLVGHTQQLGALSLAQGMAGWRAQCLGPAISLGQTLLRLPALQGACVYAGDLTDLFQACACISGNLDVLGQTAAICKRAAIPC